MERKGYLPVQFLSCSGAAKRGAETIVKPNRPLFGHRLARGLQLALLVFLGLVFAPVNPAAAQSENNQPAADNRQIRITADQLTTNNEESFAEFTGNVEAVQGDFTIRSDALRIYYRRANQPAAETEALGQDSIQKIVARGNVRIKSGSQSATSDRAEYTVNDGNLVLIGKGSTVTDGLNRIEGSRLTLNRLTGEITVEGGDQRVRAVFYPNSDLGFSGLGEPSEQKKPTPPSSSP